MALCSYWPMEVATPAVQPTFVQVHPAWPWDSVRPIADLLPVHEQRKILQVHSPMENGISAFLTFLLPSHGNTKKGFCFCCVLWLPSVLCFVEQAKICLGCVVFPCQVLMNLVNLKHVACGRLVFLFLWFLIGGWALLVTELHYTRQR